MKKYFIFFLLFIPLFTLAQNKDTVFMTSGEKIPCTINKIKDNLMDYTRIYSDNKSVKSTINLIDVAKYVVAKNSIVEDNIKYDPNIPTSDTTITSTIEKNKDALLIKSDTIDINQINESYSKQISELNTRIDNIVYRNNLAGRNLKTAGWCMIAGALCNTAGTVCSIMGALNSDNNLNLTGVVFSSVGIVFGIMVPVSLLTSGNYLKTY